MAERWRIAGFRLARDLFSLPGAWGSATAWRSPTPFRAAATRHPGVPRRLDPRRLHETARGRLAERERGGFAVKGKRVTHRGEARLQRDPRVRCAPEDELRLGDCVSRRFDPDPTPGAAHRCPCRSINPGRTFLPPRLTTSAFAGTSTSADAPTEIRRSPSADSSKRGVGLSGSCAHGSRRRPVTALPMRFLRTRAAVRRRAHTCCHRRHQSVSRTVSPNSQFNPTQPEQLRAYRPNLT
jgi:hypothetical protein